MSYNGFHDRTDLIATSDLFNAINAERRKSFEKGICGKQKGVRQITLYSQARRSNYYNHNSCKNIWQRVQSIRGHLHAECRPQWIFDTLYILP